MSEGKINFFNECPLDGKVRFPSRKAARRAARRHPQFGRMNAYPCGDFWHLGHLPAAVKRGNVGREALRSRERET
ncbi:MAG TPA: hypothetical protein VK659_19455 [Asanoa sp.]|nr:hypothetical protein [Asanoa sp.]